MAPRVPVARPRLPSAAALGPLLEEIDRNGIYTNYGPLSHRLEERLAERFGLPSSCVTTVANGTAGLMVALLAAGACPGRYCLMPSWTFSATGHAAVAAGLVPYFLDVDAQTWALTSGQVLEVLEQLGDQVGAVIAVSPFGAPLDIGVWDAFSRRHDVPVVIDAAGGFDSFTRGESLAVVSLHATKVLGAGEGGFVVSTRPERIQAVRKRANFGLYGQREAAVIGFNGKLSEYHAAIGLAGLDEWAVIRREFEVASATYRRAFAAIDGARWLHGFASQWVSSTCIVGLDMPKASALAGALARRGIDSRAWWGRGLHTHPAFASYPRVPLPVTDTLADSTLGLPLFRGIEEEQICDVANIVAAELA